MFMDPIEELLTRGVEKIYPTKEALEKVLRSGKKIRLYQGFDPSMPNLHLGNMVGILKLKQFQELGHEVIFLAGDFTGMIGDPTDKSATRTKLTREQTSKNLENWKSQAGKVLNFDGENPAKFLLNSQWSDKLSFKDLIEITSNFTAQQILERDFFQKRLQEEKPIHLNELLYPVAQAIDCVEMDVDLEIGGSDQTFNMLAGRNLMNAMKNKEKYVLTMKLLVDKEGNKVGKTAGNALFLNATPEELFGGIMSFPDEVLINSLESLTLIPMEEIEKISQSLKEGANPMDSKKRLAFEVVALHHNKEQAQKAQEEFEKVVQNQEAPSEIEEFQVNEDQTLDDVLALSGAVSSKSEAKRLIEQKAVDIDGITITDANFKDFKSGMIIKAGKRKYLKIK
jgi:tyrosyl-tRNA synthetase